MIPKPGGLSPKQNPSLTNWWWSRTMSLLSLSLNTCRFTALDLSLPHCFSAELEQPRTCLFSMKTGFLLFTSLWQGCCNTPGTPAPGHSVCRHSSESSRHRNVQVANLQRKMWGWDPKRAIIASSHFKAWGCVGGDVWAYFAPRNRYTAERAHSYP